MKASVSGILNYRTFLNFAANTNSAHRETSTCLARFNSLKSRRVSVGEVDVRARQPIIIITFNTDTEAEHVCSLGFSQC